MAADHPPVLAVHHELEEGAHVAGGERHLQRAERGLVHVDFRQPLAGLCLGQADRADLRLGEHGGRDIGMVDRSRLVAEHGVGEGVPLADRDRREVDTVGDVADRVDVRHRSLR